MIKLSLPFPISVNDLYTNVRGKGRIKTARYRTWLQSAGYDVNAAHQTPITGYYSMAIVLHEKDKRCRDPDNQIKCISDLLVAHKLITDDSLCTSLFIERVRSDVAKAEVVLTPTNGIPDFRKAAA